MKPDFYCDEPIIGVYLGRPEDPLLFLDIYNDMALHVASPFRLLLETAHTVISLEQDGVHRRKKTAAVTETERAGEWIMPFLHPPFMKWEVPDEDVPWTLFVGERLRAVQPDGRTWQLAFDDFALQLVPHESTETFFFSVARPASYQRLLGMERLLTRRCACGGAGELFFDNVFDFTVRCSACRKSTVSMQNACEAIDEWNRGDAPVGPWELPEETFQRVCHTPVRQIAVEEYARYYDETLLDCSSVIVEFETAAFRIESRFAGWNAQREDIRTAFHLDVCSSFSAAAYPDRIVATPEAPIRFVQEETEGFPALLFDFGETPLRITAEEDLLTVGLSWFDADGNGVAEIAETMINQRLETAET